MSNTKNKRKDLSEKFLINNTAVAEKQEIAENFNKFFKNIGPKLVFKILNEKGGFEKYLPNCNIVMNDAPLTDEETRNAFYSLKTNTSPSFDTMVYLLIQSIMFLTLQ